MTLHLYVRTLLYLKPIQVFYQLKYRLRKLIKYKSPIHSKAKLSYPFEWKNFINLPRRLEGDRSFNFINLSKEFGKDGVLWNFSDYGKLWTYNLNYFDFLHQKEMTKEKGFSIMNNYLNNASSLKDGKEPYPTSLRIMNWIKFVNLYKIKDENVDSFILEDSYRLLDNLEYHLLGNHLLENGFALLFTGVYFNERLFFSKAQEIILKQIREQILEDGAHFELSPMYHQIILYRVLDSLQLLNNTEGRFDKQELRLQLNKCAAKMLSWLNEITFRNGDIPLVNDSAKNIAPSTHELNYYGKQLGVHFSGVSLSDSGYRMINRKSYEIVLDIGAVKAKYQPGHTHADTFSYLINVRNTAFIVEAGTATYETNPRRLYERSTAAHNTVVIDGNNSSEVWSSFRVARRAKVHNIIEKGNVIEAALNSLTRVQHKRIWRLEDSRLIISDALNTNSNAVSFIHFHPEVKLKLHSKNRVISKYGDIILSGHHNIELDQYEYAEEFNQLHQAQVLKIYFSDFISTEIIFKKH